jgi:hypothetical protein
MAYTRTSFDCIWVCDTAGDKDSIPAGSCVEGDIVIVKGASPKMFVKGSSGWVENEFSGGQGASLPAGIILMWAGLLSAIPGGWVLCDGQNGTPDLRDKFVKGAAAGADPGATGGSATHTHADHPALSHSGAAVADHASHTHTYTQVVNHTHTVSITDPGHAHDIRSQTATTGSATSYEHGATDTSSSIANEGHLTAAATTGITASTANPAGGVATGTTAGPSATLTHSVTQPGNHAAMSHETVNSEPPYYSLAFIMKT